MCNHPVSAYSDVPSRDALVEFIRSSRVKRRRFKTTQRNYLECGYRGDIAPAMLTLTVPPRREECWADWMAQQPGAHDGHTDTPTAGMRVNVEKLVASPHVPEELKDSLRYGFRQPWTGRPPRARMSNYSSCREHKTVSGAEYDRFIADRYVEGPLQYAPWTVNAIACVVKYVPFKARNVVDFTRSEVNPHIARLECKLDDLHTVLPQIKRGSALFKFDLADAFYCWPEYVGDADYTGFVHPVTGEYYRYRFAPMGITSSPALQQSWAQVVRTILLNEGLRYCVPGTPEANYDYFSMPATYLDDFLGQLSPELTKWQQYLMFQSCLHVLADYGFPVKQSKNVWPTTRCEYTGVLIDTVRGTISLSAERCAKWAAAVEPVLEQATRDGSAPRGDLASVIGKLQWVCVVLPTGQARLPQLYVARDEILRSQPPTNARPAKRRKLAGFPPANSAGDSPLQDLPPPTVRDTGGPEEPRTVRRLPNEDWDPHELCHVHASALAELRWWHDLLLAGCAVRADRARQPCDTTLERPFLWDDHPISTLWAAQVLPLLPDDASMWEELHEVRESRVPRPGMFQPLIDFEVLTSDASGYGGGVWWRHQRIHYGFTPDQLRGHLGVSANLRELYMVPWVLRQWGKRLRGKRVLFRLDNSASVGAINKGGSSEPAVNALLLAIHRVCREFGIFLVARHLPGDENLLADAISRLRVVRDRDDWLLHRRIFSDLQRLAGPFTVDACADPLGFNAQCQAFWSRIDSCITHDWARRKVYCNPPFGMIEQILRHFWTCYWTAPSESAATFVLPVWTANNWWKLLAGAVVLGSYGPGASLFTRPDWNTATADSPVPRTRVCGGPTSWGVVLIHFPPLLVSRSDASPWDGMPRLSGHASRDCLLLRGLPDGCVRTVRGQT